MMQVYDETKEDDTVFVPDGHFREKLRRSALFGLLIAVAYCSVLGLFLWGMWKMLKGLM